MLITWIVCFNICIFLPYKFSNLSLYRKKDCEDGYSLSSCRDIYSFSVCYYHLNACHSPDQLSCQTISVDTCQYCHSCLLHTQRSSWNLEFHPSGRDWDYSTSEFLDPKWWLLLVHGVNIWLCDIHLLDRAVDTQVIITK